MRRGPRELDVALLRAFPRAAEGSALTKAVRAYSWLGQHSRLWFGIAAAGWLTADEGRREYGRMAATVLVAEGANLALKRAFRRARPEVAGVPVLILSSPGSFPSAHTTTSFAAAAVLSDVLPAAPVYAAAAAMGASRIYLGVHYPSDVLAGAVLGRTLAGLVRAAGA